MKQTSIHPDMDPAELRHLIALYDGEIRWTDEWIGRLVDRLRDRGILDNTLIILTADHGEEFFEHQGKGHRKTLYDEVLHVPLIIRYPRAAAAGVRRSEQVRSIDIYPTILELAGIEGVVPGLLGQSLVPLLHTGESDWATVPAPSELSLGISRLQSLRTRKWKIISDKQQDVNLFFDLEHDPAEQFPRAPSAQDPRSTAALRELKMYFDAYAATRREFGGDASECPVEDPDLLERLRSLGYVD